MATDNECEAAAEKSFSCIATKAGREYKISVFVSSNGKRSQNKLCQALAHYGLVDEDDIVEGCDFLLKEEAEDWNLNELWPAGKGPVRVTIQRKPWLPKLKNSKDSHSSGIAEKPVPESIAQNKEIDDLRHQMASLVNIAGALLTIVKAKQALDPTPDRDPCTSGLKAADMNDVRATLDKLHNDVQILRQEGVQASPLEDKMIDLTCLIDSFNLESIAKDIATATETMQTAAMKLASAADKVEASVQAHNAKTHSRSGSWSRLSDSE